MQGLFENIEITGMAAAAPERKRNTEIYETILGARHVRRQRRLTGIDKTHVSGSAQRTSDLCYAAAVKLIDHLKWNPEEIDVLIYISQSPNYRCPSTAFLLQKRLSIKEECLVYDINMGCSAFNVGVQAVASHLSCMKQGAKGLLLVGDMVRDLESERALHPENLKNAMLFGAAGCAVALQNVADSSIKYLLRTNGERFDAILGFLRRPLEMDGNAVFDFAINVVSKDIISFQEELMKAGETVDYYSLHQGQKMILDSLVISCSMEKDKVLNSYPEFGNTNGASVVLNFCANCDRFAGKDKINVLASGFGVGLSWGILYTKISTDNILPVIYTDEHFDEDKKAQEELWNKTVMFLGCEDPVLVSVMENFASPARSLQHAVSVGKTFPDLTGGYIFENTKIMSHDVTEIVTELEQKSCKIDGIVVSLLQFSPKEIVSLVKAMKEKDLFHGFNSSILLLEEDWGETVEKEKLLQDMFSDFSEASVSINMIMYKKDSLRYVKKLNRESLWVLEYIESDFDMSMSRATDVANVAYYLLSDKIAFVNGTVIKIDDKIKGGASV